jgi:hypothetical protein
LYCHAAEEEQFLQFLMNGNISRLISIAVFLQIIILCQCSHYSDV